MANNNKITSITVNNGTISIIADVANLEAFASSDPDQGTHKWLAIGIDTGITPITKVSYGSYQFTEQDVADAAATGCNESSFVLYVKADEVINTPKEFTLSADGYETQNVTITVAQS